MYCAWTRHQQNPCIALTWAPEGKRSRERPEETLKRTEVRESQKVGFATWIEVVTTVKMEETSQWPYVPRGESGTKDTLLWENRRLDF